MEVLPPAVVTHTSYISVLYAPAVLITVVETAKRPARDVIVTERVPVTSSDKVMVQIRRKVFVFFLGPERKV